MAFDRPVIDSHLHLYSWFNNQGQTLFEGFDEYQRSHGFEAINLCALPFHYGDIGNNIMAALYKLHNPTAYAYGGIAYPELPVRLPLPEGMDALSQYRELMEIGFDGIKLIETKPDDQKLLGMPLDHPFYEPFFAAAEADGTHLVWHVADPETFWDINRIPERFLKAGWFYGDGTFPSYGA